MRRRGARRAERAGQAPARTAVPGGAASPAADESDLRRLVHELETYQEELQAQQAQLIESQRQLEASRDRYADLFDFAPIGYVTLDRNGVTGTTNLAAARLVGLDPGRATGVPFLIYVHPDDRRAFLMHMHHCRHSTA